MLLYIVAKTKLESFFNPSYCTPLIICYYKPEVLIIGTGQYGNMAVTDEIASEIRKKGIEVIVLETPVAVKRFNEVSKSKKTIGAFHLTC